MSESSDAEKPYISTMYFFILSMLLSIIFYIGYYAISSNQQRTLHPSTSPKSPPALNSSSPTVSSVYSKLLLVISQSFLWYAISISFTIYNKWLMKVYRGGFDFPFAATLVHMITKYLFSRLYVHVFMNEPLPVLRSNIYLQIVVPIGVTTALDIGMSNLSISCLTLSLYTIIKTTVVGWTFLWGVVYGLETFSLFKATSITGVVVGLSLAVISDISASLLGIIAGTTSAACGGLRWVFVQLLQKNDESSKSAIIATYRFSAVTVLAMLPLVAVFEAQAIISSQFVSSLWNIIEVLELLLIGGIIGCILIIVEISLLNLTSSLTLSIIGELKEAIQIMLSMIAFHDKFSWIAGAGVVLAITSAETYRKVKAAEMSIDGANGHVDTDVVIASASYRGNLDVDDVELMKLIYDGADEDEN